MKSLKKMLKEDKKISDELAKYSRKCSFCGHTMIFYKFAKKDKLICTCCGKYIYKDDFTEFKEKFNRAASQ